MQNPFLKIFTVKAIGLYLITLSVISLLWSQFFIGWQWVLWGIVFVVGFFGFSYFLQQKWSALNAKKFVIYLFLTALCLRVVYVIAMFYYYYYNTGYPFEYDAADSWFYHRSGVEFSNYIRAGKLEIIIKFLKYIGISYSDTGYIWHLSIIYTIFGRSLLTPRLIKALMGAYVCVMVYRMSVRTFDEKTARLAAIFTLLMPTLLYYTGLHMKETEMLFWTMLFLERSDFFLRTKSRPVWNIFLIIFSLLMVFGYRSILGVILMFSFLVFLLLSSEEIIKRKVKVLILSGFIIFTAVIMMTNIGHEVKNMVRLNFGESKFLTEKYDKKGMDYSEYANGKYFFPGAFVLPLSPMVSESNENQKLLNGAMYDKNYLAFFAMLAIMIAFQEKKWRKLSLIGSFTISYLLLIGLSPFFNSERYYFPVLPCFLIMAAYGITHFRKRYFKLYYVYLVALLAAVVIWNYVKLRGRGVI